MKILSQGVFAFGKNKIESILKFCYPKLNLYNSEL